MRQVHLAATTSQPQNTFAHYVISHRPRPLRHVAPLFHGELIAHLLAVRATLNFCDVREILLGDPLNVSRAIGIARIAPGLLYQQIDRVSYDAR